MVFLSFVQHCFFVLLFVMVGSLSLLSCVFCLCWVSGEEVSLPRWVFYLSMCALHTHALLYCIVLPFVQHCVCCVFPKRRWRPVQCFTCQRVQSALCSSSSRGRESCFLHMQRSRLVSCHSLPRTWPPCHSVSCWELGAPVSGTWRLRRCSQASPCQPPR